MSRVSMRMITVLSSLLAIACSPALSAEPPSETQLERLMETASQTPDRPDHDYATNSLEALLRQSQELKLSKEQTDKIKTIKDQYDRTRRDRATAYKRSEMDALKLIHDSHSSLFAIMPCRRRIRNIAGFGWRASRRCAKQGTSYGLNNIVNGDRTMRHNRWLRGLGRNGVSSMTVNRARRGGSHHTDVGYNPLKGRRSPSCLDQKCGWS
jgi:hypothetical protein